DPSVHRLGLVVAPAGTGKTTFLHHLARELGRPTVWVSGPTDTSNLFQQLLAGSDARGGARRDNAPDEVAHDLARRRAVAIVDDAHELTTDVIQSLARLATVARPPLSIVIGSRQQLDFNWSKLRLAGELFEVGADDLRFRTWEVEELFRTVY